MKRWMESCTTISGRGWSQGFGAIFEDGDLGRDPEHDNKLKNGVGDVLALWDIWRRRERTGMGKLDRYVLGGYVEGVGYRVRWSAYHLRF